MSERHDGQDDERLERELRELLGRREAGPSAAGPPRAGGPRP